MNSDDTLWMVQWERMVGRVPSVARDLHQMSPTAEESYRNLRLWIYQERADGIPYAYKELLMIVLNVAAGNSEGAISHLNRGLKNGLTVTQVREALAQCFLSLGVIDFLKTGQAVWQACAESIKEDGGGNAT